MVKSFQGGRDAATLAEVADALNASHPLGANLPALVFMTDETRTPDPVGAIAGLPPDCAVLFRHYDHKDRRALATRIAAAAHDAGRQFIVAGDLELARAVSADGLHLPAPVLGTSNSWRAAWRGLLTASAHSKAELEAAAVAQCDAAFLSPVFTTESHPRAAAIGIERFAEIVGDAALPIYGLGGVTSKNAPELLGSGAVGIAAIGGLL